MPRLSPGLLWRARNKHTLLPLLLRSCRDIESARNELRWLRELAFTLAKDKGLHPVPQWPRILHCLCFERSKGRPLQYLLGNQPFGDLEILCRSGVLIPRSETESITSHLASLLPTLVSDSKSAHCRLRILDLCTGTGCITLLLQTLLRHEISDLQLCGVDVSSTAISLAHENLQHNICLGFLDPRAQEHVSFIQDDIFEDNAKAWKHTQWDVLISNPPYISPRDYNATTSRSVRKFEPKLALVPPHQNDTTADLMAKDDDRGDAFYFRLLEIADAVKVRVLLMEVGDMDQAQRVAGMVKSRGAWKETEIWRDWPNRIPGIGEGLFVDGLHGIKVKGEGHGRAVLAWR